MAHLLAAVLVLAAAAAHSVTAAVPQDLSNFQGEWACDPQQLLIVRPHSLDDVAAAVRLHAHVKAVAEGHSWNRPFFCAAPGAPLPGAPPAATRGLRQAPVPPAPSTPASAGIVMSTLRPLRIDVNESSESVWVDAPVKTIDLLQFLAARVSPTAPAGWTLGAFPWFTHQSIGGAVSTGTHGSSLIHNSLSHQVLGLDVILANGTRRVFTPETDPQLMKALRVSVGKLGIIARVQLRIVREVPVRRSLKALSVPEFVQLMQDAQQQWTSHGEAPSWMNETQIFWLVQQQQFMLVSFTRADTSPEAAKEALAGYRPDNSTVFTKKGDLLALGELVVPADAGVQVASGQVLLAPPGNASGSAEPYAAAQRWLDGFVADVINAPLPAGLDTDAAARTQGVRWRLPAPKPASGFYGSPMSALPLLEVSRIGINQVAGNLSAEATAVYIKQPASTLINLRSILYDQYEVSIPLAAVGACWARLVDVVYDGDLAGTNATQRARDKGFRTAPLIRFVGAEPDALLSQTHDGPRAFLNVEDYKFYNNGSTINAPFKAVMAVLTSDPACTSQGAPRLHWGKAGWPDAGCWHGDAAYGNNWCSFGCAMRQLDPAGKFADAAADRWTWAGVDLERCCEGSSFKSQPGACVCAVHHARQLSDCPPAPFYSDR